MTPRTAVWATFASLTLIVLGAQPALALGACKAKVDRRDGGILIRASGAVGEVRWGALDGLEKRRFDNATTCVVGSVVSGCRIGPVGSLAAATPTHTCDFHLRDASGASCKIHLRRCTPGLRGVDLASAFPGIDLGLLEHLSLEAAAPPLGVDNVLVTGVNLQIVDGSGDTYGTTAGRGNVIVGYDEGPAVDKGGSHNVVIGPGHRYANAVGGLVAGRDNMIANIGAVVIGGEDNQATGLYSTVAAGEGNVASGDAAVVAGGHENEARGGFSVVAGGSRNTTSGEHSAIFGGRDNVAANVYATVCGGGGNRASGPSSTIIGGQALLAVAHRQTICAPSTN